MTLVEFLLARIAEDEKAAAAAEPDTKVFEPVSPPEFSTDYHIEKWCPSRVLTECEAKRRIVEAYEYANEHINDLVPGVAAVGLLVAIKYLASVHADHQDYRQEWRP